MSNEVSVKFTQCKDCNHSHVEAILTADSFEHESGIYCGKCKEPRPEERWGVHSTDDRLIASDEWDPRKYSDIPDWCPLLFNIHSSTPDLKIEQPYRDRDKLSLKEMSLLVKAVSKVGNVWVEGFYIKMKSGSYDSLGHFVEKYMPCVVIQASSGGATWAEVYEETICKHTGLKDDYDVPIYEHDYLDPKHYNEVECFISDSFNINGDTPLRSFISGLKEAKKEVKVYGNYYDSFIYKNQEKERVKE